ncbi:MAG: hypothetical protein WAW37_11030 [Syntrophobacteraceae bacterium]
MTTEDLIQALKEGRIARNNRDFIGWRQDYHELKVWTKMLADYEEALKGLKGT